jgi:hypothetical protein
VRGRGPGWFNSWRNEHRGKPQRHAPVLTGAREKDPLATPQSPLTQMSDGQLQEEATRQERERQKRAAAQQILQDIIGAASFPIAPRSAPAASAPPDAGAQNLAPRRAARAQPASRAAKKQKRK